MNDERGTITLWVLGLCVALMFLGGLSLDLWRAVAARRELSGMSDAAATAAANGVDEDALRNGGAAHIDPARARAIANDTLADFGRSSSLDGARIDIDGDRVTVTLRDHVDFSLLGIFLGGQRFEIETHASAEPDERG